MHAYEKELKNQDQALKKLESDLDGINRKIADMQAEMASNRISPRRSKALLEETRMHEEVRRLLLNDISAAAHTIEDMRSNLEQMKTHNPFK